MLGIGACARSGRSLRLMQAERRRLCCLSSDSLAEEESAEIAVSMDSDLAVVSGGEACTVVG